MQQRKGLYDEILKVITEKAKSDGYDLVFDKSGVSASLMPFLLFSKDGVATDFTPELIIELNKNAPAGGSAPPATACPCCAVNRVSLESWYARARPQT